MLQDSESSQQLSALEKENEELHKSLASHKADMAGSKQQVDQLEFKLAEAKELCKNKTEENEKMHKILQTKIASIKEQLQSQQHKVSNSTGLG